MAKRKRNGSTSDQLSRRRRRTQWSLASSVSQVARAVRSSLRPGRVDRASKKARNEEYTPTKNLQVTVPPGDSWAITAPEMRTLVIQPWDASTVTAIEKGIQAANLGLNPSVDGKVIRINLPDLSKERRQEMVKAARKLAEDGRGKGQEKEATVNTANLLWR